MCYCFQTFKDLPALLPPIFEWGAKVSGHFISAKFISFFLKIFFAFF